MAKELLIPLIVSLLGSGFILGILNYVRDRRRLPHEIDSIISTTAGSMVTSMALVNQTQEGFIKELKEELARHKMVARHVARGLDNLSYPELTEYSDELRTLLL